MDITTALQYQKRAEAVVAGEHLTDEIMGLHGAIMELMEELKHRPSDEVGAYVAIMLSKMRESVLLLRMLDPKDSALSEALSRIDSMIDQSFQFGKD